MMDISKSDPVVIVGGGAFGLSTALHLSRAGFHNVTVLEKDTQIPPRSLVMGSPAKVKRELTDTEVKDLERFWQNYVSLGRAYLDGSQ